MSARPRAIRVGVSGTVQGVGFRDATRRRALALGVLGWVRNGADGSVEVHAEGEPAALAELLAFLRRGPRGAAVADVESVDARVEGHEQFAIRGVSAGPFAVIELSSAQHRFELRLPVGPLTRAWALQREPSLDPAAKRLAIELPERPFTPAHFAPATHADHHERLWDHGAYEQGGRVPWPQALERGHAVFVLHGELLTGGFALQRTGAGGEARWLLVKRRDDHARPCPAVAERRR